MMKKIYIATIIALLSTVKVWPCGGDWEGYFYYYSLIFSQELINDARYYPFLLAPSIDYYEADSAKVKNANIEEWQEHLKISYEQAYYLVFKTKKEDIEKLLADKSVSDQQLKFANKAFTQKHKESLQYLLIAKELEPYMVISGHNDGWYYYEEVKYDIQKLPYDQISLRLQKGWKQAKDKEIKLRYGYQLVRFAHYNRKYEEAVELFDMYVEPLQYKPEMYYYALSQKAGAIRGIGGASAVIESNDLFFEVFSNSTDIKTTALTSMKLNDNVDYQNFQTNAKTIDEKNDADLLLGYISFSNPLASARRIVQRSPDAIQAKVLAARAIAILEGDLLTYGDVSDYKDKRLPIVDRRSQESLKEALSFVTGQADSNKTLQKNYWNIASAYLYYLDRNYSTAQSYLKRVDVTEEGYREQHDILAMLVDIGSQHYIDKEVEDHIYARYSDIFDGTGSEQVRSRAGYFVLDLLSNRYYLQEEYAKSFMLLNSLSALNDNPHMGLLTEIEDLYNKPDKSTFEEYLVKNFRTGLGTEEEKKVSVPQYIKYIKGMVYLTHDEMDTAKEMFEASGYSRAKLSSDVFGYNQIECFECEDNMKTDYLNEFSYIKDSMSEEELVNTLVLLRKDSHSHDIKAAKANYLIGNFYYNTSLTGYYRNYLRFGYEGSYRQQFFRPSAKNAMFEDQMNLKYIPTYYDNPVKIADQYLKFAYSIASGSELKARIAFALSKCEQEMHYQNIANKVDVSYWGMYDTDDWVKISKRRFFAELMKYKGTDFFEEVKTNCKYFEYYVNHSI